MLKLDRRVLAGVCAGVCAGLAVGGASIATGDQDDDTNLRAHATIMNAAGDEVGEATFTQRSVERDQPTPPVMVRAIVRELGTATPRRGFHVHENAACGPTFLAAGGHADDGPNRNGGSVGEGTTVEANHPYHAGDLPNLRVNGAGIGHLNAETTRFTLQEDHPTTLFDQNGGGSAVIVHLGEDRGEIGPPDRPGTAAQSAGGARVACGVVVRDDEGAKG